MRTDSRPTLACNLGGGNKRWHLHQRPA